MGRPRSNVSKAILALPATTSAKDVLTKLKAKGLKSTESNIYRVRRLAKKGTSKRTASAPKPPSKPHEELESLLRLVAAEIGLGRARNPSGPAVEGSRGPRDGTTGAAVRFA